MLIEQTLFKVTLKSLESILKCQKAKRWIKIGQKNK